MTWVYPYKQFSSHYSVVQFQNSQSEACYDIYRYIERTRRSTRPGGHERERPRETERERERDRGVVVGRCLGVVGLSDSRAVLSKGPSIRCMPTQDGQTWYWLLC